EWVHVQLHQQKGMISLSPPTICNSARKTDVTIAKNYLRENELKELNRIVNMWLDFAEDQALRRKQVFLQDWDTKLDQFLSFNDRDVLQGAGGISKKAADEKAREVFDIYAQKRRQLKEAEGARANIAALKDLLKKGK
ncbi:virulence RhuM family protein, partial [Proteus mirabilis]|uniref:RhuM family protein n=1 Tax=Proteus mirabilis TaxID=584 RepID=UPI0023F99024